LFIQAAVCAVHHAAGLTMKRSRKRSATQAEVWAILDQLDGWLAQLKERDTPGLRSVRRKLSRVLAKAEAELVLGVADALAKKGYWADLLLACEMIAHHRLAFAALDEAREARHGGKGCCPTPP
jgi:uncharacterized protein (DUF305 family)